MSQKKNVNRREFIKSAATAAGALTFPYIVPSSALGKAGTVVPSNRIVLGCIGVGGQGSGNMQEFLNHSEAQVPAVCDVDRNHRNRARDIVNRKYGSQDCATYNDFREVIDRKDIDALSLATTDQWHAIPAIMAARAGMDMYSEKPLAYSIVEGRAICNAVKRYGVVWQTGSWQRSTSQFHRACELVRNGRIGKVHTVRVGLPSGNDIGNTDRRPSPVPDGFDYDMWLGPAPRKPYCPARCHWNFRWISDYSGGQLTDWAGHHCDIAQWGMDTDYSSPVEIDEAEATYPPADEVLFDTAESYRFVCKYAEGFTMIVADANQQPKGMGTHFEGSEGWVHVSRGGIDAHPKSVLDSVISPNEVHLYKSNDHIGNFLDCVKSRSPTITPVEVAHRSIMIAHLGIIAMKLGRKLKWEPQKERFINDPTADRLLMRPMRGQWHL